MKKLTLISISVFFVCAVWAQTTPDSATVIPADSSHLYGLIPELPVKVGEGKPQYQREYLESLRDAQGNKVSYERAGACCSYTTNSPWAMFGGGMLDKYEIKYRDEHNKKRKAIIYITFYDYEKPKAIKGFTLVE